MSVIVNNGQHSSLDIVDIVDYRARLAGPGIATRLKSGFQWHATGPLHACTLLAIASIIPLPFH